LAVKEREKDSGLQYSGMQYKGERWLHAARLCLIASVA
jgi:hypothetical protein